MTFWNSYDSVYDNGDAKYITEHIDGISRDIETAFQTVGTYTKKCADMPHGKPSIIFCFDEANTLVSSDDLPFLCLRRALRYQKKINKEENIFGVILDTDARYNPWVPRPQSDPHGKLLHEPFLNFDPIFELNKFDSLSVNNERSAELTTEIYARKLYSLGRPLWQAYATRYMPSHAVRHATKKLFSAKSLYKMSGDVLTSMISPITILCDHLGETLVADHLRMIYDINAERLAMSTI